MTNTNALELSGILSRAHSAIIALDGAVKYADLLADLHSAFMAQRELAEIVTSEQPLDDEQICEAVAAALTADGLPSEAQYTGGGIWCVSIEEWRAPKASWLCGMSCDMWAGTLMEADSYACYEGPEAGGEHQFIHTDVSSESQDVAAIAGALARAVREWRTGGAAR